MALRVFVAVVGILGPGACPVLGQNPGATEGPAGSVLEARMEAGIPAFQGSVPVRLEYRVAPSPSALSMPVTLLQMEPARVSPLRVSVDGRGAQVTMREARDRYSVAEIPLLGPRDRSEPVLITLEYAVLPSWDQQGKVVLPLVAPGWTPADPGPRSFMATVRIPAGMRVASTFPTSVLSRPRGDEGGEIVIALQAVPSVLILRTSGAGSPGLTLERALDGFVVAALLVMMFLGIRFIRGPE